MNCWSNFESAIAKPAKGHRECQYDSGISTNFRELPAKKEISRAAHLLGRTPAPRNRGICLQAANLKRKTPSHPSASGAMHALSWAELTCSHSLIFQGCWEISEAQDRKSYCWVILPALINMKQQKVSGWSLKSINLIAHMLPDFPSPSCGHLAEALGRWFFQLLPCCSMPSRLSWFLRAVLTTSLPGLSSYSWIQAASMPCGPTVLLHQS